MRVFVGFKAVCATVALGAILLNGCSRDSSVGEPLATGNDTLVAPLNADVTVQAFAFRNDTVRVAVGGTVTFTNQDVRAHPLLFADERSFSLAGGEITNVSFDESGVFSYRCAIHASMTGTVIVGETEKAPSTSGMSRGY